ncbi:MAG: ABC transporter substrate-binding protein [Terriglobales bacterium]
MPQGASTTGLNRSRLACWLSPIVLLAGCLPALGQAARLDVVRVEGTPTITITVALRQGMFRKYGIEVQSSHSSTSDAMRAKLANGEVDIIDNGLDNAVAMVLGGVDAVIVTGSRLADQELLAQPDIKSVRDLRGKTVLVDAPNTQAALLLKKILLLSGLRADVDYQLLPVGTRRLPEMRAHKEYAAAMLSGSTAILAKREGFVSLGTSSSLIGPILYYGSFVRRQWARDHADLLSRYIAANIEAQRWLLRPANKAEVIEILRDSGEHKVPADVAAEAYAAIVKGPGALTKELRFNVSAFKNFLKVRAEVEGSWQGVPPQADRFYDLSYYDEARKKLSKGR